VSFRRDPDRQDYVGLLDLDVLYDTGDVSSELDSRNPLRLSVPEMNVEAAGPAEDLSNRASRFAGRIRFELRARSKPASGIPIEGTLQGESGMRQTVVLIPRDG